MFISRGCNSPIGLRMEFVAEKLVGAPAGASWSYLSVRDGGRGACFYGEGYEGASGRGRAVRQLLRKGAFFCSALWKATKLSRG